MLSIKLKENFYGIFFRIVCTLNQSISNQNLTYHDSDTDKLSFSLIYFIYFSFLVSAWRMWKLSWFLTFLFYQEYWMPWPVRCKQLYMYVLHTFSWLLDQCPGCLIPSPIEEKTVNIDIIQKEKYMEPKSAADMPFNHVTFCE